MRSWFDSGGLAAAALGLLLLAGCAPEKPSFSPGPSDPDAPTEFSETPSGLRYRVLRGGSGNPPGPNSSVTVHYVGRLDDGTEFDSSYRTGRKATFSLSQVIPAWTEGLQLVQPGGMIELQVPPELGYGREGVPGSIPPAATLHFTVELFESR
ncbi:MAG: FKBP-type peptidyl-prolyl cis-trans isomerase [Planctomycetaceae bacterium]|nr:MAG: FKBP-type peptidyl-prolyl cis-trans isomerase [Planctomycetaceae bacterium]